LYQVESSLVDATTVNASNFFASGTFTGNGFAGNAAGLTNFIFGWWYGTFSTFSCTANFQMLNPSQTINGGDASSLPSFQIVGADGLANKIADQYSLGLNIQSGGSGHLGNSTFGSSGFTNTFGFIGNGFSSTVSNAIPVCPNITVTGSATTFITNNLGFSVLVHYTAATATGCGICPTNGGVTGQFYLWSSATNDVVPLRNGGSISITNGATAGVARWTPFP
jgi:hypothetical protein